MQKICQGKRKEFLTGLDLGAHYLVQC